MNKLTDDELDRKTGELMGWEIHNGIFYDQGEHVISVDDWHPTRDWDQAMQVRDEVAKMKFSTRLKFKTALQKIVSEYAGCLELKEGYLLLEQNEIILWVRPKHIVIAAVKAVEGESNG